MYDGANVIEELDQFGAAVARYVQGPGVDEPLMMQRAGEVSYYEADGLGTVTSLSTTAGALANTYTYDSFGKLTASSGTVVNPFRYTGREFDSETAVYYHRARYRDVNVGIFLSEDFLRIPDGRSSYLYAANSPTTFFDPFGLCPWEVRTRPLRLHPWELWALAQFGPADNPPTHNYFYNTDTGESVGLGNVGGIGITKPVSGQWLTNEHPQSTTGDQLLGKVPDKICECVDNKIHQRGPAPNYCGLNRTPRTTPCTNCWNWTFSIIKGCSDSPKK